MPVPRRSRIRPIDSKIFSDLFKAQRPLPVRKIATRTNYSWPTVDKSVRKLAAMDVLKLERSVRRTNVSINPILLEKLRRMSRRRDF